MSGDRADGGLQHCLMLMGFSSLCGGERSAAAEMACLKSVLLIVIAHAVLILRKFRDALTR